jgi:hypothetical protein
MAVPEAADQNPYVGPRPFEPGDADRFFGRRREVRELLSLVIAHRVVLLYAASGAGRSSLLNAGLIPSLLEKGFQVLSPARLGAAPAEARLRSDDIYTASVLASWTEAAMATADRTRLEEMLLTDYLRELPRPLADDGHPARRALVIDQFEELFTAYPEHWQQRPRFLDGLADAAASDRDLRIVLAVREDFLASLDPYASHLPDGLRTRYRLQLLDRDAAVAAVRGPLEGTPRSFADGVAESLVEELLKERIYRGSAEPELVRGQFVEPVHLQVVCHRLWAQLPSDLTRIEAADLGRFGNLERVLEDFYVEAVASVVADGEIGEAPLRRWIADTLITPIGTRSSAVEGPNTTEGIPNDVVHALDASRLIRREARAGANWWELTHDRLIGPIQRSNEQYFRARTAKRRRRIIPALIALILLPAVVVAVLLTSQQATTGVTIAPTLSPSRLDFGSVGIGGSTTRRLTLSSGSNKLAYTLTTSEPNEFTTGGGCPNPLAAGRRCSLEVSFSPAAIGQRPARLTIQPKRATALHVALTGSGFQVCGVERWAVKTLADPRASLITYTPISSTGGSSPHALSVSDLTAIPVPAAKGTRQPQEMIVYEIRARLVTFRIEEDSDVHLVIADLRTPNTTMIVEFPGANCNTGAPQRRRTQMAAARAALIAACGQPRADALTRLTGTATITGVAFIDAIHGQTGIAPNGIELHPVLQFTSQDCHRIG